MVERDIENKKQVFVVEQPGFTGSLSELSYALRTAKVLPQDVDVYQLVQAFLGYFAELQENLDLASEALPLVARVIELKVRFLLPQPPKETEEDPYLDQTLEAISLLEELEEAIVFLRKRREARRIVLPAKAPKPSYPRARRPLKLGIKDLKQLASRYSFHTYFEVAIERFTMASAMKQLKSALKRLKRGRLHELIEHNTWEVLSVSFSAMLELFKEGKIQASQAEAYGPIELEWQEVKIQKDAA